MDNIEIKNLNFSFDSTNGHVDVFSGLNATFDKGKITCIVGHSGCGKTTLLNILSAKYPNNGCIKEDRRYAILIRTVVIAKSIPIFTAIKGIIGFIKPV